MKLKIEAESHSPSHKTLITREEEKIRIGTIKIIRLFKLAQLPNVTAQEQKESNSTVLAFLSL